jgi:hypothetical protein
MKSDMVTANVLALALSDTFERIELGDALALAATFGYVTTDERRRLIVARIGDGIEIAWQSEGELMYGEETPGGFDPPTVWARRVEEA